MSILKSGHRISAIKVPRTDMLYPRLHIHRDNSIQHHRPSSIWTISLLQTTFYVYVKELWKNSLATKIWSPELLPKYQQPLGYFWTGEVFSVAGVLSICLPRVSLPQIIHSTGSDAFKCRRISKLYQWLTQGFGQSSLNHRICGSPFLSYNRSGVLHGLRSEIKYSDLKNDKNYGRLRKFS